MGQIILSNCRLFVGGYNMSGKLNAIALNNAPDVKENTTFGMTAKSRKKGLDVITADLEGFWEQEPDEYFSTLGIINVPMTVAPEPTVSVDVPAYSFLSQNVEYMWGGSVGELGKFSVKAESVGSKMIRGHILENGAAARVETGTGTILELGGISIAQYLYGTLHVIAAAAAVGDTLDVIIESDSVVGFDTPIPRMTFTQVLGDVAGGRTYQWATPIAGAIADTFWRAKWTIGGATPSFTFVVFMGIA